MVVRWIYSFEKLLEPFPKSSWRGLLGESRWRSSMGFGKWHVLAWMKYKFYQLSQCIEIWNSFDTLKNLYGLWYTCAWKGAQDHLIGISKTPSIVDFSTKNVKLAHLFWLDMALPRCGLAGWDHPILEALASGWVKMRCPKWISTCRYFGCGPLPKMPVANRALTIRIPY